MAEKMLTKYAFEELGLHRIEANVMPKNKASLRVLEKNQFINEGISKYYLKTPCFSYSNQLLVLQEIALLVQVVYIDFSLYTLL